MSKALCYEKGLINWPNFEEQRELVETVEELSRIPGFVGFIDGTHVLLVSAPGNDSSYYNRKGFPSCQLQLIVDCNMLIRDAYCGWPGSTHNARVFRNSPMGMALSGPTNELLLPDSYIIGDSAYPLTKFLITPFKENGRLTAAQRYFNRKFSSQRQNVERVICHPKGRFRRLKDIDCKRICDIVHIIILACALHNLCVLSADPVEDFINPSDQENGINCVNVFSDAQAGTRKRNEIVNYLQQLI